MIDGTMRLSLFLIFTLLYFSSTIPQAYARDAGVPLLWNAEADKDRCPDKPSYLWAEHPHGSECIRYFTSGDVAQAPVVIIEFYGDRDKLMRRPPQSIPKNTREAQEAYARAEAKKAGVPVILMARPGTFGSTGNHDRRRQPEEFLALNRALDLLRERYAIEKLVLLGQSGGATAGAALLTLGRSDIHCAVLTSGAFALLERARRVRERNNKPPCPGCDTTGHKNPYDPLDHIRGVATDPERTIYILGSAQDRNTPFLFQRRFATALQDAGHRAVVQDHQAKPPMNHRLTDDIGIRTAGECARQ